MARILKFEDDEDGKRRFSILLQALLFGSHAEKPRPVDVLRREGSVYEHLTRASKPTLAPDGQQLRMRTLSGPAELLLEQPEVDLLVACIPTVAWQPDFSGHVVAALDWLAAAPLKEPDKT